MIKFIKTLDPDNKHDTTNVTIELPYSDIGLNEAIEAFDEFLKACGYVYDGKLDIVVEE